MQVTGYKSRVMGLFAALTMFFSVLIPSAYNVSASSAGTIITPPTQEQLTKDIANDLKGMFKNFDSPDNAYLINRYGKTEVANVEARLGIKTSESSLLKSRLDKRGVIEIGNCMLGKLGKDIRALVDVAAIVTLIQKKAWLEAAKVIVAKIAANGIKRNAAIMAGTLAWYAIQCGMGW